MGQDAFQPQPPYLNTHPPDNVVYHLVRSVATVLQNWAERGQWLMRQSVVNGKRNIAQKPFLVYSVSTIFVAYCGFSALYFRWVETRAVTNY